MVTIPNLCHVVLHCYTVFHKDEHLNVHYKESMPERYSIAEARRNLPRLVHEAERGKAVELTRRGEPVAMIISHRRFEQLASRHAGFTEAYRTFAERVDLVNLDLDPGQLFSGVRADTQKHRQPTSGRSRAYKYEAGRNSKVIFDETRIRLI